MPEKKVGVKTTCTKCRSEIICRMTNYSNFENKLQWQNEDGANAPKITSGNLNQEWD